MNRRLAEAKGSPAIDHEDVLIVRKPGREAERFPLFEPVTLTLKQKELLI